MSKRRVPFEANPFGSKTAMVRRRPKRKAPTNKSLNRKIKRIQNDIELKYKDVYSAATDISTTTALTLLNGISQGDTTITRTGGQVRLTSVHIKGTVTADPLNLLSDQYRMMVVWDAQANGAAPTLSGTVTSILDVTTITDLLIAPYNYSAMDRFKILMDKRVIINRRVVADTDPATGATQEYQPIVKPFNKRFKLGRTVRYAVNSSTGTITDISTNSLYFIVVGNVAPASVNPQYSFHREYTSKMLNSRIIYTTK